MYLTEDQQLFRDAVRKMAEKEIAPIAAEIDDTDRFPKELVPIFGDMGLLQMWVPEQYGGPGGNLTSVRSEEHTSELQSLMRIPYAVFCLKKKKNINSKPAKIKLHTQVKTY